jgi:drug/metabolite transporter (DMT)-like permease
MLRMTPPEWLRMRPRPVFGLLIAAACWGTATAISKRAVGELPPLTLLTIQLAASVVGLAILMRWRGIPWRDPGAAPLLGRLGILNPGIAYLLSLLGLVTITASLSVVLWALEPILILVLAGWALREPVGWRLLAGTAIAVAGAIVVSVDAGTGGALVGIGLTIAGVLCCAVYTVVARRFVGTADGTLGVVATQQLYALLFTGGALAIVAVTGGQVAAGVPSPLAWVSAVGSGLLYFAIAYWFYLSALRDVPASVAASSFYLIPLFGLAASFALLGETLDPMQWAGIAIGLAGVSMVLRTQPLGRERERAPAA